VSRRRRTGGSWGRGGRRHLREEGAGIRVTCDAALYTNETRWEPSDWRSTAVNSWAIWATWDSLFIVFLFLFRFYCTIVK
jgi:hypothetical protein